MSHYAIAGLVVRTRPEELLQVAAGLATLPGIEVHHPDASSGRVVITLESDGPDLGGDALERLRGERGVLSVELVYQYVEPPVAGADLTPSLGQGAR